MVAKSNLLVASEEGLVVSDADLTRCGEGFEVPTQGCCPEHWKHCLLSRPSGCRRGLCHHTQTSHRVVTIQHSRFACFSLPSSSPSFPLNNRSRYESLENIFEYLYIRHWARNIIINKADVALTDHGGDRHVYWSWHCRGIRAMILLGVDKNLWEWRNNLQRRRLNRVIAWHSLQL